MKDIELTIELAKEDLEATRGVCESGTVACKLWHTLDGLIEAFEERAKEHPLENLAKEMRSPDPEAAQILEDHLDECIGGESNGRTS